MQLIPSLKVFRIDPIAHHRSLIQDHDPCHSLLAVFIKALLAHFAYDPLLSTYYDTSMVEWPTWLGPQTFRCDGPAQNETRGILVGSGLTPVTMFDWKIETKIHNGPDAGELIHSATAFSIPFWEVGHSWFLVSRSFTNASGAPVTVNECGIVAWIYKSAVAFTTTLIIRDLIDPVELADAQSLEIEYAIEVVL